MEFSYASTSNTCLHVENEKGVSVSGIDKIPDVQATHESKTKKRRVRSSVTDGVYIKDGKYGCQFCDKVFEGWRQYIGHVGNHVKGSIKSTKGSVPQPAKTRSVDRFTTKIDNSKMNALVEIAQNSIQDISLTVPEKEPSCVANIDRLCMAINGVAEHDVEKCGSAGKASSPVLKSNACSRKPRKGDGKDRIQVKRAFRLITRLVTGWSSQP